MPKTTNLGLNLTTDDTTKFVDWRKSIDGSGNTEKSNMEIIDEAIGNINGTIDNINGTIGNINGTIGNINAILDTINGEVI